MALSTEMRGWVQKDLGITADQAVFTDAELDALFSRANEDYNLTIYYGYRQLKAVAVKFRDYTEGLSSEKRSQIWDHINEMVTMWKDEARGAGNQLSSIGLSEVPERNKEKPWRARRRRNGIVDVEWPD